MPDSVLRVLHLGNVANNAYLNAKILRPTVDSEVLSYAHYHIMGSPEWEESDFTGAVQEFHPDWRAVDLGGFRRPEWFVEGPLSTATSYLEARHRGGALNRNAHRFWLDFRRDLICGARWAPLRRLRAQLRPRATAPSRIHETPRPSTPNSTTAFHLGARYAACFPDRADRLTVDDVDHVLGPHRTTPLKLRQLFAHYDIVHAYGAEPVLPLVAGTRPYVAFEHGTIRALPFLDSPLGRLTALAYREADAVLITNADNRAAAERLGISNYRFAPHAVHEVTPAREQVERLRRELSERLDAEFLVFHPSRQHWHLERDPHLEKGNDRLIEGLATLFASRPRCGAVFVNWGATQDASRALLAERGIQERVLWMDPMPGPALACCMAAADVIADQFFLGAFGGITPRALYLGIPPLLFFDETVHRWCFDEQPPVLNAVTPSQIADQLTRAYDNRGELRALGRRGQEWYWRYHSNDVIRRILLETYEGVRRGRASERDDATQGVARGDAQS